MTLSLIGIILVQLYWVNTSLKNSEEQFKSHIRQVVLKIVGSELEKEEAKAFYKVFEKYRVATGKIPSRKELLAYYGHNKEEDIVYSDKINRENYNDVFFEKDIVKDFIANQDKNDPLNKKNTAKDRSWEDYQIQLYIKDFRRYNYLENWITTERLQKMIGAQLLQSGIKTPFEFGIYNSDGVPTKVKSPNFKWDRGNTYDVPIFEDDSDGSSYQLLISFPEKERFLFSEILGITLLSVIFTLIIIIAYLSAINQLIKQKQISEIKTDFINNMTHEFKTPIATINLALDAIKNPKIFDDKEKVQRYLQMIKDENKRMHSQVENVLQISKLDKKELEIVKEQSDIQDIIENAIEHVYLIIEARQGTLTRHYQALRTTTLLNDVHFTNVLVNILDNAIKYSPEEPVIDIYTENVKDFILIKIQDRGLGMSKITQKRIFEKFYREHTGDIHNVKGHGLGLAYVKRIIDDHNCHIYVESEKGKGSTFIIKMPLIN